MTIDLRCGAPAAAEGRESLHHEKKAPPLLPCVLALEALLEPACGGGWGIRPPG